MNGSCCRKPTKTYIHNKVANLVKLSRNDAFQGKEVIWVGDVIDLPICQFTKELRPFSLQAKRSVSFSPAV